MLFTSKGIDSIDLGERLENVAALFGEIIHDFDEVAAAVCKTVREDDLELLGDVA